MEISEFRDGLLYLELSQNCTGRIAANLNFHPFPQPVHAASDIKNDGACAISSRCEYTD